MEMRVFHSQRFKDYEGDYFSEELQVTFRLELKEGKLYFVHRNAPKTPLRPILRDRFIVREWKINFIRNTEDRISFFSLRAGRVKNLKFYRK